MRVRNVGVATRPRRGKNDNHSRERCNFDGADAQPSSIFVGETLAPFNFCRIEAVPNFSFVESPYQIGFSAERGVPDLACVSKAPLGVATPALLIMVDTPQQRYT